MTTLIITKLREARGWSRQELSRRTGLSPAVISHIETGRLLGYTTQLARIARELDVEDWHDLLEVVEP